MTTQEQKITITVQATPNPHSMKFTLSQKVAEEHLEVNNIAQAGRSPLAQKIMGFPWVDKVFIGPYFITINKQDWVEWDTLTNPLADMILEHIESGQAVLHTIKEPKQEAINNNPNQLKSSAEELNSVGKGDSFLSTGDNEEGDKITQQIKHILDTEIQPAVAQDGGFIAFVAYKKGQVFLKMQGACSNCPSASMTLKHGIETHLKNRLPKDVKEVIAT